MVAAMRRALACTFSAAPRMAEPPTTRLREPPVPLPIGVLSVSPWRTTILSKGTPRWSAMIWANVVSWPWPCAEVFSRVVALARRRRVGERRRRDEVLAADLLGLLAELLRDDVDQPFEVVRGLRPSRAAIRGHRRRVGEHAGRLEVDVGELVDA